MVRNRRLLLSALLLLLASSGLAEERAWKVIINAGNPADQLKKDKVALLFLDRSARWSFGAPGDPVDQSTRSPLREAFSKDVLGKPVILVQQYWQQRILQYHEMPPPVKSTDADVIEWVAKHRGGVGYVASATELPTTVKVLAVVD